jgi:ribosomal protein S27AE
MKECFKCNQVKPLSEFYAHPQMADGHLNKCKECNKADVRQNYVAKRLAYAAYYQAREQTARRKEQVRRYAENSRKLSPEKYAAHTAVGNAVLDGRLKRQPCEVCGAEKVEAHHDDYSKPLDVRWLCFKHHREVHGQKVLETV